LFHLPGSKGSQAITMDLYNLTVPQRGDDRPSGVRAVDSPSMVVKWPRDEHERSGRILLPGTPNDVRFFPPVISNNSGTGKKRASSRSIPIAGGSNYYGRSESEEAIAEEEALAEYRDYVMYERIRVARTNSLLSLGEKRSTTDGTSPGEGRGRPMEKAIDCRETARNRPVIVQNLTGGGISNHLIQAAPPVPLLRNLDEDPSFAPPAAQATTSMIRPRPVYFGAIAVDPTPAAFACSHCPDTAGAREDEDEGVFELEL